ncbi:MAG TPA: LysM peptidoglycan-binding domain-containing protein [Candidatus Dormibacteraeota bacterium]|nr:LysM peptidoglycan-binding domain-containing protein [Candidatus Dormibacteraeota bacterium]
MSSYALDVNQSYRRARYHAPRVPGRKAARIKIGRVVVVLAILWVVFMQAAYGGPRTGTEQVTVQPGQTVWSIAAQRYPDDDTRGVVGEIVKLNHLGDAPVYAGEKIQVPAR